MRVERSLQTSFWSTAASHLHRVAPIALPVIAGLGLIYLQKNYGLTTLVRNFFQNPAPDNSAPTLPPPVISTPAAMPPVKKLPCIIVKGLQLEVDVVEDKGDCLFLSFIAGIKVEHQWTPEKLRAEVSKRFLTAIDQEGAEDLISRLAFAMRIHLGNDEEELILQAIARDGFESVKANFSDNPKLKACTNRNDFMREWRIQHPTKDDELDNKDLARRYCELLAQPLVVYPGEDTIKEIAELLNLPTVLVNGDSLHPFGPRPEEDVLPIMIYQRPDNAHFDHLVVNIDQWKVLREGIFN